MTKPLLVLAALACPLVSTAFEWAASAGLRYARTDDWTEDGLHSSRPHLNLDLRLDGRGDLGRADIFRWRGGVAYARISDRLNDEPSSLASSLRYQLEATALQYRGSQLSATAYANRTDSRYDASASASLSGDSTDETIGGVLTVAPRSLPALQTGYDHRRSTATIPGLPVHESERDLLTADLTHSNDAFGLALRYRGEWSDGTWVSDQNRNYAISASGQSTIGTDSRVYLSDVYSDRTPTSSGSGAGAYAQNTHSFQGGLISGALRGERTLSRYAYSRGLTEAAATTLESIAQSVRIEQEKLLSGTDSRSWLRFLADGTLSTQRSGTASMESGGETVGTQLWHYEKGDNSFWEAGAGPLLAALHIPGESTRFGYGLAGSAQVDRDWSSNRVGLNYLIDYGNDVYGRRGWSLRQRIGASLSGPAFTGGLFSTSLSVSTNRGWNPVLGDDSTRNIQLDGRLSAQRTTFEASLGLASGLAGNADPEFLGDGLFLPSGFDSHTTYGRVTAITKLPGGLVSRLQARITDSSLPGQPDYLLVEGSASLSYRYAAFDIAVEDRLAMTERGSTLRTNLVLFTVARTIGTRF